MIKYQNMAMGTIDYRIKVFDDFQNIELKTAWRLLEKETCVFPQMYYEWIEPWWRFKSGRRKLHIVTVVDNNDKIVGIAPFCVENILGYKILKNIPIHFGDFYDFILPQSRTNELFLLIFRYCNSFKSWHLVQINQVPNAFSIFDELKCIENCVLDKVSDVIIIDINFETFEKYLAQLSKKENKHFRRRLRRLKEIGNIELLIINAPEDYLKYELDLNQMYIKRWGTSKSSEYKTVFKYRSEAFCGALFNKTAIGFILLMNSKPIAYRLGFLHNNQFISWKLVYDPDYSKFGVGSLISLLSIEPLIHRKIKYLNLGAGVYDYKTNWLTNYKSDELYTALIRRKDIFTYWHLFYSIKLKKMIKRIKK